MDNNTCHLNQIDLQDYVRNVFGADYLIDNVSQMHGGAQKLVYKIDCSNGFSCVLYVWDLLYNINKEKILILLIMLWLNI